MWSRDALDETGLDGGNALDKLDTCNFAKDPRGIEPG
jgi:hypothetical protein